MSAIRRSSLASVLAVAVTMGASVPVLIATPAAAADGFFPLAAPVRLLDTRAGGATVDGQFSGIGERGAGTVLELKVAGRGGIPDTAPAVALNVTAVNPAQAGYVTVFPCGQPQPLASNLNVVARDLRANAVIAIIGTGGNVCIFTLSAMHLVVDASGSFPTGAFNPLPAPRRVLDTRPDGVTFDGQHQRTGKPAPDSVYTLPVSGRVGLPGDPGSVVLNVTAVEADGPSYVTVYPCGSARPTASNLNVVSGQAVANLVVAKVGDGGAVCLFTLKSTHLVVDVSGVLPGTTFIPLAAPQRVLDTRLDGVTADAAYQRFGRQPYGATIQLDVAGRVGIPEGASSVVLNVTAVAPTGPGYLTVHPRGSIRPEASNLNYVPSTIVPNAVIAGLGSAGEVCVFNLGATDVVVDVAGYLTGPAPANGTSNCPSVTPTFSDADALNQLLRRPELHDARGTDRIAVLACNVPGGTNAIDPVAAAAWANANVAPYFAESSLNQYAATFQAHPQGTINAPGGPLQCLNVATAITGAPFTNVLVIDNSDYGGGFAGPGAIGPSTSGTLTRSPAVSGRGAYVGGDSVVASPSPMVAIHEIGHTIHWPHSYTGVIVDWEYDNPLDVMSGMPVPMNQFPSDPGAFCSRTIGSLTEWWHCKAQHTLAFNRFASGWVRGTQVGIHRSGRANYTLDHPTGTGVQLVALPDATDARSLMTLEARPAVGRDAELQVEGVAVHIIDQNGTGLNGISLGRRTRQATGAPDSYQHVVPVGGTLTVLGVTITVLQRVGNSFEITVTGTYTRPPFAFSPGSGALRIAPPDEPSCAIDIETALENGCVL